MKKRIAVLIALVMLTIGLCACSDSPVSDFVASISGDINPPRFSHQTGMYEEGFTLTVSAPAGTTVRYTLDGSEPTPDSDVFPANGLKIKNRSSEANDLASISAKKFTLESDHTPPRVTKGTVVRAAAFSADGTRSHTTTTTYFVGLDYRNIKMVSLVLDSKHLFDYETGIYVFGKSYDEWVANDPSAKDAETWELEGNFSQKGREWERPVLVQVIDENGQLGIEQNMGIRIMGAATRRYYQKSFRLTAREEYGSKHFIYPIISGLTTDTTGEPLEKFKSFNLRNGGNDNGYAFLRDPFIQSLVEDRDFTTQGSEPCLVFINGEYWGLYAITEDYSDNYIQYNYDIDNKNVIMVKNWELEEGTEEDMEFYRELENAAYSLDFTDQQNYEWVCSVMDIESFIDYMAVTIYINNEDGIIQGNNWRIWRARETDPDNEYADGKWRFMLYDTDMSMGLYSDGGTSDTNTLQAALDSGNTWGTLFSKLMQNNTFKEQFVTTFMDLRNTAFYHEYAVEQLTKMKLEYAPYVVEQYKRNGPAWVIQWSDVNSRFDSEVNVIRRFINGRYGYAPEMLLTTLELGESFTVTLKTNTSEGGTVRINTVTPDLSGGSWSGAYFSDYPVTLIAEPAPGYVFAGWSGAESSEEAQLTINLSGNISLTATFEKE